MGFKVLFDWPWGEPGLNPFARMLYAVRRYGLWKFFARQPKLLASFKAYVAENHLEEAPVWSALREWWDDTFGSTCPAKDFTPAGSYQPGYDLQAWAKANRAKFPFPLLGVIAPNHQQYLDWWQVPDSMESVSAAEALALMGA